MQMIVVLILLILLQCNIFTIQYCFAYQINTRVSFHSVLMNYQFRKYDIQSKLYLHNRWFQRNNDNNINQNQESLKMSQALQDHGHFFSRKSFQDLNVSREVERAIDYLKLQRPSKIQALSMGPTGRGRAS